MINTIKKHYLELLFFLLFVATRIPDLGHDVFNTDVWKWKARTYDFGTGVFTLDFEKTIQKYHPGVTLMWLGTVSIKVYNLYVALAENPSLNQGLSLVFGLHFTQKLFVTFAIGFALAVSFYVLRRLFGTKYALICMFLTVFDPFYMGLTRVFHLEGLMSTFMLASFLLFYWHLRDFNVKRLVFSGIFAGLSVLTKTSALYLIPFSGLALIANFLMTGKVAIKSHIKSFCIWLLVLAATFVLLWPAMWTHPLEALTALYRGVFTIGIDQDHAQFYFGNYVGNPGSTFYFVVLALKSSVYLLPGLLGYFFVRKKLDSEQRKFVFYCFIFALFYFIQLSIPLKKLDRYILPAMMALLLIASFSYYFLLEKVKNKFWLVFAVIFIPATIFVARLHPDYFSYYNPYFGGLKRGMFILEPKWLFGQKEIVDALRVMDPPFVFSGFDENIDALSKEDLEKRRVVGFQEKYYTQIWPFVTEAGMIPIIEDLTPHAQKAQFFAYPVWDDIAASENRFSLKLVESVYLHNVEIFRLYKKTD